MCEPLELEQLLSASGILRVSNHALLNDLLFYYEDSIEKKELRTEIMTHPSGLKDVPTLAENITVAAKALFGLGFTVGSLINGMQAYRLATDDPSRNYLTIWAVAMMICAVYLLERAVGGGKS